MSQETDFSCEKCSVQFSGQFHQYRLVKLQVTLVFTITTYVEEIWNVSECFFITKCASWSWPLSCFVGLVKVICTCSAVLHKVMESSLLLLKIHSIINMSIDFLCFVLTEMISSNSLLSFLSAFLTRQKGKCKFLCNPLGNDGLFFMLVTYLDRLYER